MQEKIFVRENDRYTVFRMEQTVKVKDFLKDYVDVAKFEALCRACPNYGKRWSCPPFADDPMEIWEKYTDLRLIAHILVPKDGTTCAELLEAHEREKVEMRLWLTEQEKQSEGNLALWAGTCDLCVSCAKAEGKSCRFPEKMFYEDNAISCLPLLHAKHYEHIDTPLYFYYQHCYRYLPHYRLHKLCCSYKRHQNR